MNWRVVLSAWRSLTGARTGPTAAMPWPLASKPEATGGAGDVDATMAADAASATVKVARRINGSRNISRGISESSNPRISRNNSSISRGISRNNSSIGRGINKRSKQQGPQQQYQRYQPRHQPQQPAQRSGGWGPSCVCFRCGKHGHFMSECRAVPPTRSPGPYTGAQAANYSYSEDYADFGSGPPPSQSAPALPDLHASPVPSTHHV